MNKHQVTRTELYKLLWKQTKSKIAAEYGVKLRVINIAAKEMDVPTPPQGYWTKIATGVKPDIPTLPEANESTKTIFSFLPYLHKNQNYPPESARLPMKRNLHPIAKKNIQYFKKFREWDRGMVLPEDHDALGFTVTKKSVDRAIRIMNSLIWAFEKNGWEFWSVRPKHPHMRVKIANEEVVFTLKEPTKRKDYELTKEEQQRKNRGQYVWHPRYTFTPTGNLTLAIESGYGHGKSNIFSDKINVKVEDQLGLFISQLSIVAEGIRELRLKREHEKRKEAIKSNISSQLSQLADKEIARRAQLIKDMESWKLAESIREYLKTQKSNEDLSWAYNYADILDPTTKAKTTILEAINAL